jgi:hypothetical protein
VSTVRAGDSGEHWGALLSPRRRGARTKVNAIAPAAWRCSLRSAASRRAVIKIQERKARTKRSFGLRPLLSSPGPGRCTGSPFAAPRFCARHKKVPLQIRQVCTLRVILNPAGSAYREEIPRHLNAPKRTELALFSVLLCVWKQYIDCHSSATAAGWDKGNRRWTLIGISSYNI